MSKEEKYKDIIYRLRRINNSIYSLSNSISSIKNNMQKTLLINDNAYCSNNIDSMNNSLSSVSYTISNIIIPNLNRKI